MARNRKALARRGNEFAELAAKVTRVDPPGLASADAYGWCHCDDGCDYLAKRANPHREIHHAEWLCTRLGQAVGIPTIAHRVLELPLAVVSGPRDRYVFGSRWEPGELRQRVPPLPDWWELVRARVIPLSDVVTVLSWIYGFDHFIHNIDRHLNNYFVRHSPRGSISLFAFDYSRAWTYRGFPLQDLPFDLKDPQHTTVKAQRDLTRLWGNWIDASAIDAMIANIKRITKREIKSIIEKHPKEWLSESKKRSIIKWWGSKEFIDRLDGIAEGVRNGTYL